VELLPANLEEQSPAYDPDVKWEMKELKPKHREVAALFAQGFKNIEVANMTGFTPEYISMLLRQPLVQAEVRRISEIAGVRLEAMFSQTVDVIGEAMRSGSHKDKIAAARLHLEATKRIGRPNPLSGDIDPSVDRLSILAERLLTLQSHVRNRGHEANAEIIEAEFSVSERGPSESAQEDGNGQAGANGSNG